MPNLEKAILEGGPSDGLELTVNLDFGPFVTVIMPPPALLATDEERAQAPRLTYSRSDAMRDGRRVYVVEA